jgi:hypothetical protein
MSKRAVVVMITAFALLLVVPAAAPAKKVKFSALSENFADVTFGAKGKKKKKGEFKPKEILYVSVVEEPFACYKADGSEATPPIHGTTDAYPWGDFEDFPIDVNKKGKFSQTVEGLPTSSGAPRYRLEFEGRIKDKKARGTYRAQVNYEGGIDTGYCGDDQPVEWNTNWLNGLPD